MDPVDFANIGELDAANNIIELREPHVRANVLLQQGETQTFRTGWIRCVAYFIDTINGGQYDQFALRLILGTSGPEFILDPSSGGFIFSGCRNFSILDRSTSGISPLIGHVVYSADPLAVSHCVAPSYLHLDEIDLS